jgi:hypothetical protein
MIQVMATVLFTDNRYGSEMDFDSYNILFGMIVDLARELVVDKELSLAQASLAGTAHLQENSRAKLSFTFDFEIIPPLFIVATKCRDRKIRRGAIRILLSSPRREGLWDSIFCGKLAERIVEIEEEGMAPFSDWTPSISEKPREERRVVIKEVSFDLQRREGGLRWGQRGTGNGNMDLKERETRIYW